MLPNEALKNLNDLLNGALKGGLIQDSKTAVLLAQSLEEVERLIEVEAQLLSYPEDKE